MPFALGPRRRTLAGTRARARRRSTGSRSATAGCSGYCAGLRDPQPASPAGFRAAPAGPPGSPPHPVSPASATPPAVKAGQASAAGSGARRLRCLRRRRIAARTITRRVINEVPSGTSRRPEEDAPRQTAGHSPGRRPRRGQPTANRAESASALLSNRSWLRAGASQPPGIYPEWRVRPGLTRHRRSTNRSTPSERRTIMAMTWDFEPRYGIEP
jgi:hypothetical protein